ncbi:hypothetical protein [Shinella oryzae]|uniref:Transposase n=1 Tax=Shinella oryzae TaxID=2871820 RepID=A0ABY9KDN8_9HYPH|nr:hypothetical protein [Shinella oryzae]WLS06120.1 hypothetical protein Q9315_19915 [Shinella oryzae]
MKKKLVQMIDVAKTVSALSAEDGCWMENGSRSLDAVFRMPVFQEATATARKPVPIPVPPDVLFRWIERPRASGRTPRAPERRQIEARLSRNGQDAIKDACRIGYPSVERPFGIAQAERLPDSRGAAKAVGKDKSSKASKWITILF